MPGYTNLARRHAGGLPARNAFAIGLLLRVTPGWLRAQWATYPGTLTEPLVPDDGLRLNPVVNTSEQRSVGSTSCVHHRTLH
jgi:hypothetical protein